MSDATTALARIRTLPREVVVLGFVSLAMDASSEMIHALLPLFVVGTLGASAAALGLMEGVANATALVVKVFSGALSDWAGKRKGLAVLGYGLAAVTKPIFPLSSSVAMVFGARVLDRVGKGIRGAPRDALIADVTPKESRGAAYGLRQAMDTVGAFLGPLVAFMLMSRFNDFRVVFWAAVIPAAICVALLVFGLREPEAVQRKAARSPISRAALSRLPLAYWGVVAIGTGLGVARFSEAFLSLRSQQSGLSLAQIPLALVAMNAVYALAAYPLGSLADRVSRRALLAFGLAALIASELALAAGATPLWLALGFALWGLSLAATEGVASAWIADLAPGDLRGTAFGVFNLAGGVAAFVASLVAGALWEAAGAPATFLAAAAFAGATLAGLVVVRPMAPRTSG